MYRVYYKLWLEPYGVYQFDTKASSVYESCELALTRIKRKTGVSNLSVKYAGCLAYDVLRDGNCVARISIKKL